MTVNKPFILTFGSCGWDRIFYKNSDGTKEFVYEEEGRKNSHQALAAKRAGAKSILVSFVGDDEIGSKCLESLKSCGIETQYVNVVRGKETEINIQYIDRETKDYTLERGPAELSQNYDASMVQEYKDLILKADFVVLVSKQPKDFLTEMINFCYNHKIPTSLTISHKKFDIKNSEDFDTLKKCTVIAGNAEEGELLTGLCEPDEMLKILPNLVITKGAEGVWFSDETGKVCHEMAVKTDNVVETNGAGDTFIGNLVVFLSEKQNSVKENIKKAMCASSLEIQKMGVLSAIPEREQTEALYESYYNLNNFKQP